jgi:hypothetical protein
VVVGQAEYSSLAAAQSGALPTIPMSTVEWKLLYRVTYRNVGGTATYIEAADYRTVSTGPASTAVANSHAALIGRDAADSHPYTAISGLGTAATGTTGTASGNIPTRPDAESLSADHVTEITSAHGVDVDGVLCKDGVAYASALDTRNVAETTTLLTWANTYTAGPAHGMGYYAYRGGVLMPNGKVCLVPHNSDNVGIYDPVANTHTAGPAHGMGDAAYVGGVLMPNGKVCLVPFLSDNVGIYDPVANTHTAGPAHGMGDAAYIGGVLVPNGKVCLVPFYSDNVGIYDPVANTHTAGPAHGLGNNAFAGGVLVPNGKVCLVPFLSDNVGIYDHVANTYTAGPAHGMGDNAYYGGVLVPNGKVCLVPYNSGNVGIYITVGQPSLVACLSPYFNKF